MAATTQPLRGEVEVEQRTGHLVPLAVRLIVPREIDVTDPQALTATGFAVTVEPNPTLIEELESFRDRRGDPLIRVLGDGGMTLAFSNGEEADPSAFEHLLRRIPHDVVVTAATAEGMGKKPLAGESIAEDGQSVADALAMRLLDSPAEVVVQRELAPTRRFADAGARRFTPVVISTAPGQVFVRFHTSGLDDDAGNVPEGVALDMRPAHRTQPRAPRLVRGAQAARMLSWARHAGFPLTDDSRGEKAAALLATSASTVAAWPAKGRPAQAAATIGADIVDQVDGIDGVDHTTPEVAYTTLRAEDVVDLEDRLGGRVVVDGSTRDVVDLTRAEPVPLDELKGYQQEDVGKMLTSRNGLANITDTGGGKGYENSVVGRETARAVAAYLGGEEPAGLGPGTAEVARRVAARAERTGIGYRELIVCPANMRKQHQREWRKNAPEVETFAVFSRKDVEAFVDRHQAVGSDPLVAVISAKLVADLVADTPIPDRDRGGNGSAGQLSLFDDNSDEEPAAPSDADLLAQTMGDDDGGGNADPLGSFLLSVDWTHVVSDEANGILTVGSKISRAMTKLRRCADRAYVLTGTPLHRSTDDLGRAVAWAIGDFDLFHGASLRKQFPNLGDDETLQRLRDALGPLFIRRDKAEFEEGDRTPIEANVRFCDAGAAQTQLVHYGTTEARRALEEIIHNVEVMLQRNPDNPNAAEVREALSRAQGNTLGLTTLLQLACSDPGGVSHSAMKVGDPDPDSRASSSLVATMLDRSGLVGPAAEEGSGKMGPLVEICKDAHDGGEQTVVFTNFARAARTIEARLNEEGLRAGRFADQQAKRRDAIREDFVAGNLDVLVCTSAAEVGLDLQTASTLVMYDLPWTAHQVKQRVGRLDRIGQNADRVRLEFLVLRDTIEERVAAVVASRAMLHMRVFDDGRDGVEVRESSFAQVFGELAHKVDTTRLAGNEQNLVEACRAILLED